ncbi:MULTISPECIES: DUF2141 domain-containing protein [unclassified Novosphingobium]|uniref:DUF2141 domain-containing protein n=1 Tax=unclassified Novosphingobium TaxID=2644732 RepID=UPI00135B0F2C|nr:MULTISPECIES: DUF2141 domain-containing protein [unclassified Novosphingobium]
MTRAGLLAAGLLLSAAAMPSSPDLGKKEGQCRPGEWGPSLLVTVAGLKDRQGNLKLEIYPADDEDFLADDNVLLDAGKVFRRVEVPVPPSGPVDLCIRLPAPGIYAASLLHDRDGNHKFGWAVDGIGFSGNPKLGWSKPKAAKVAFTAGSAPTRLSIVMNYRSGLGVAPLKVKG